MELQELLKTQAIELGLCQQWQDEWGTPDVDALCDKFIRGIDFCIKHDFPKVVEINYHFHREDLERNGIFTQPGVIARSEGQKHVITMGESVVDVFVPDYSICDIYIRHNSKVNLHAGANSFVYFTILDNGKITIKEKQDGARIKCSYYSGVINNKDLVDTIHNK
jgi:hypothetical protein